MTIKIKALKTVGMVVILKCDKKSLNNSVSSKKKLC
jgi:hypothetical protein